MQVDIDQLTRAEKQELTHLPNLLSFQSIYQQLLSHVPAATGKYQFRRSILLGRTGALDLYIYIYRFRMARSQTVDSSVGWSCSTLRDGVDVLMNQANEIEEEEANLLKLVKDCTELLLLPCSVFFNEFIYIYTGRF